MEKFMQKYLEMLKLQAKIEKLDKEINALKSKQEKIKSKKTKIVFELDELEKEIFEKILQEPLD